MHTCPWISNEPLPPQAVWLNENTNLYLDKYIHDLRKNTIIHVPKESKHYITVNIQYDGNNALNNSKSLDRQDTFYFKFYDSVLMKWVGTARRIFLHYYLILSPDRPVKVIFRASDNLKNYLYVYTLFS